MNSTSAENITTMPAVFETNLVEKNCAPELSGVVSCYDLIRALPLGSLHLGKREQASGLTCCRRRVSVCSTVALERIRGSGLYHCNGHPPSSGDLDRPPTLPPRRLYYLKCRRTVEHRYQLLIVGRSGSRHFYSIKSESLAGYYSIFGATFLFAAIFLTVFFRSRIERRRRLLARSLVAHTVFDIEPPKLFDVHFVSCESTHKMPPEWPWEDLMVNIFCLLVVFICAHVLFWKKSHCPYRLPTQLFPQPKETPLLISIYMYSHGWQS